MKPILQVLQKEDCFSDSEYELIASLLTRTPDAIKILKMETVKEMIYAKLNPGLKLILDMSSINQLQEQDCCEYNNIYNKSFNVPHYIVLEDSHKSKLALSILNVGQRRVMYDILDKISCSFCPSGILTEPITCLLDAPSGTGKSFLIDCLYLCMKNTHITIIARNKTLLNSICTIPNPQNMNIKTTCKFIMETFSMEYNEAIQLFKGIESIAEAESTIKLLLGKRKSPESNLIIIDEYSMESPLFLSTVILMTALDKSNLLIIGDSKQQNTLMPSKLHNGSNFSLLKNFPNIQVYNLDEQMRIKDDKLLHVIEIIKSFIERENCESNGNVKNTFQLKFEIYKQLKEFFVKKSISVLNCIYLTDTHVNIKKRALHMIEYAQKQNINWKIEPYELIEENNAKITTRKLLLPEDNPKFLHGLLLIEGCQYLYQKKYFVTCMSIKPDHVTVKNDKGELIKLTKVLWTKQYHECVDVNFKWIMGHVKDVNKILQYPLRQTLFTHYFVQGLTFKDQKVVIDIDALWANSLYVAFSRITKIQQIVHVLSSDVINFIYTQYKNDDYLYKIPKVTPVVLDNLQQFFVNPYHTFQEDDKFVAAKVIQKELFKNKKVNVNCKIQNECIVNKVNSVNFTHKKFKRSTNALEDLICHMYPSQISVQH